MSRSAGADTAGRNTIWIDLSDLADWCGHLTGIQRVEYNLVRRFRRFDNVRYFVIDDGRLLDVDFDDIEYHIESEILRGNKAIEEIEAEALAESDEEDQARRGEGDPSSAEREAEAGSEVVAAGPPRSLVRRSAKRALGQALEVTPFVSKDRVIATYDTVMHQAKISVGDARRSGAGMLKPSRTDEAEASEPIRFQRGDLVLVLGGNWGRPGYLDRLGREVRRSDGILFAHVLYDLIPAISPGYFPQSLVDAFEDYIKMVLTDTDFCFAISEHSRSDARMYANRLGIEPPPISTFRLGDDLGVAAPRRPKEIGADQNFIFCPGTIEVRKNHQLLYHTYRLAAERDIELPHLVIGGKLGWLAGDVFHLLHNDPVIRDQVTVLTTARDSEFEWLYRNAAFVVYPSAYEGWGLPVAESLHHGKLCLASNASSLPEVGGDLVEYFSPEDTAQLMELLVRYSSDPELVAKREAQIQQNYRPTSWDETFADVLTAIEAHWPPTAT